MLENHNILTYYENTNGAIDHFWVDVPFFLYTDSATAAKFIPGYRAKTAAKRGATIEIRLRERSIQKPSKGEAQATLAFYEHFKNNHNYFLKIQMRYI